jgi:hypothetical protein
VLEQVRKRYEFVVAGYVVMPEHSSLDRRTAKEESFDRHAGSQTRRTPTYFVSGRVYIFPVEVAHPPGKKLERFTACMSKIIR